MRAAIMLPVPAGASSAEKYSTARTMKRIVFAIMKTITNTIHGTSSAGFSCKQKKSIEILKFVIFMLSLIYFAPYKTIISFNITFLFASTTSKV
jgi:hypothetical protein